jgi:hypothetical protein
VLSDSDVCFLHIFVAEAVLLGGKNAAIAGTVVAVPTVCVSVLTFVCVLTCMSSDFC